MQANHASASPHAHGTASVLAKTPERPSSVEGLWLGAGMSADSIAQPGWAAPVPDLAAQARETLYAMGQQQRLPVFPESEDSGELTERMRLLSMAHSQVGVLSCAQELTMGRRALGHVVHDYCPLMNNDLHVL